MEAYISHFKLHFMISINSFYSRHPGFICFFNFNSISSLICYLSIAMFFLIMHATLRITIFCIVEGCFSIRSQIIETTSALSVTLHIAKTRKMYWLTGDLLLYNLHKLVIQISILAIDIFFVITIFCGWCKLHTWLNFFLQFLNVYIKYY